MSKIFLTTVPQLYFILGGAPGTFRTRQGSQAEALSHRTHSIRSSRPRFLESRHGGCSTASESISFSSPEELPPEAPSGTASSRVWIRVTSHGFEQLPTLAFPLGVDEASMSWKLQSRRQWDTRTRTAQRTHHDMRKGLKNSLIHVSRLGHAAPCSTAELCTHEPCVASFRRPAFPCKHGRGSHCSTCDACDQAHSHQLTCGEVKKSWSIDPILPQVLDPFLDVTSHSGWKLHSPSRLSTNAMLLHKKWSL